MNTRARIDDARARWLARRVIPHEPALRARVARLVASIPALEVDDVVQQCYAILSELDDVAHVDNPRAYVFTVARSVVLQHIRHARIVPIEAVAEIEQLGIVGNECSPERHVEAVHDLRRTMRLLAALPDRCREAFVLRKVEGLSQHEIAQRMGISESTVEKHIGKGLRHMLEMAERPAGSEEARESGNAPAERAREPHEQD